MQVKEDMMRSRNQAFSASLVDMRAKLAVANAILVGIAVSGIGDFVDWLLVFVYFALNVFCVASPFFKRIASGAVCYILLLVDLVFTCFMMIRTGGPESDIYPFCFLPIVAASARCGLFGVLAWSSIMAAVYLLGATVLGYVRIEGILIKIGYLYMVGIFARALINKTYMVAEAVSSELERKNTELKKVTKSLKDVAAGNDVKTTFRKALEKIYETGKADMAAILFIGAKGELDIADYFGWKEEWVEAYHNYPLSKYSLTLAPILVFKDRLICNDIRKHSELVQTFSGLPVQSLAAYPLKVREELVGVVMITNAEVDGISEEDSIMFESIAEQTGVWLAKAMELTEANRKADTDGLTGLYNRRYFNDMLKEFSDEAVDSDKFLSLIMMDVDNFKSYNDTYGHPAGDTVLRQVAQTVKKVVAGEGIVARYGGEEVVVILPDCENEIAMSIAEEVRAGVEALTGLERQVTLSLGVASYPEQIDDVKDMLDFADKSLYMAKHTGKNRVCCGYDDEVVEGK